MGAGEPGAQPCSQSTAGLWEFMLQGAAGAEAGGNAGQQQAELLQECHPGCDPSMSSSVL